MKSGSWRSLDILRCPQVISQEVVDFIFSIKVIRWPLHIHLLFVFLWKNVFAILRLCLFVKFINSMPFLFDFPATSRPTTKFIDSLLPTLTLKSRLVFAFSAKKHSSTTTDNIFILILFFYFKEGDSFGNAFQFNYLVWEPFIDLKLYPL